MHGILYAALGPRVRVNHRYHDSKLPDGELYRVAWYTGQCACSSVNQISKAKSCNCGFGNFLILRIWNRRVKRRESASRNRYP